MKLRNPWPCRYKTIQPLHDNVMSVANMQKIHSMTVVDLIKLNVEFIQIIQKKQVVQCRQ